MKLVLYDFPPVPSPQKVRVAMAEKGVSYERVVVDLRTGAQRDPDYLSLNPHGLVPTLVVDGTPIYESTAIMEFLEETYPAPPLLPKEPLLRARVRMIEESIDQSFAAALKAYGRNLRPTPPAQSDPELAERLRAAIAWHNAWLDDELEGRTFLAGEEFSVADIAAICNIDFQIRRLALALDPRHTNLAAWYERTLARRSMKALGG